MKYNYLGKEYPYHAKLFFVTNDDNEFAHAYVWFFIIEEDGTRRSTYDLADFRIKAQADSSSIIDSSPLYGYGFSVENIGLNDYKKVSKIFSSVENKYNKLAEKLGYPRDFSTYALYIMAAIGVVDFEYQGRIRPLSEFSCHVNNWINAKRHNWYNNSLD